MRKATREQLRALYQDMCYRAHPRGPQPQSSADAVRGLLLEDAHVALVAGPALAAAAFARMPLAHAGAAPASVVALAVGLALAAAGSAEWVLVQAGAALAPPVALGRMLFRPGFVVISLSLGTRTTRRPVGVATLWTFTRDAMGAVGWESCMTCVARISSSTCIRRRHIGGRCYKGRGQCREHRPPCSSKACE